MLPWRFASIDLIECGLISATVISTVVDAAKAAARPAVLRGNVDTSLEAPETRLHYRLMDGEQIACLLPELNRLYRTSLVEMASALFSTELVVSPALLNGVNINVVEGSNSRYEWHVDSNPVTGVLSFTDSNLAVGGRLLFGQEESTQVAISLKPGQFLVFDARQSAHSVETLRQDITRVTAPMNFYLKNMPAARPPGLDEALYGQN